MPTSPLGHLFNPRGIAVIGASAHEAKIGHMLLRNIVSSEYRGSVYPVNLRERSILGLKAYRQVQDIPGVVDLAVIVIPAPYVKDALDDCGEKGVPFAVIITSGFKEVGNREGEAELVAVARKHGMRILGPNVFGLYSASAGLNCTFAPALMEKGSIGLISQSGALGVALMGRTAEEGLGLSCIVSVGNKADISEVELVEHLGQDPMTRVILIYLEGTKHGRELMEAARKVVCRKPIVVIKAGSSVRGSRAAASHTGSLAGSDAVFDAAFRQMGVLRARSLDEAFDWVRALATQPRLRGDGTVIITNGGGAGVMATDACEREGVSMLNMPSYTSKLFGRYLPPFGSTANPVDITGQATETDYENALRAALRARRHIHAVIGIFCETANTDPDTLARSLTSLASLAGRKPILFGFVGGKKTRKIVGMMNRAGFPAYTSPERAASALGALYRWKRYSESGFEPFRPHMIDLDGIRRAIQGALRSNRRQLLEPEVRAILSAAGLSQPKTVFCADLDACIAAAEEIGYPVVLKVVSPEIVHKTEAGGVRLNLGDAQEVSIAYEAIMAGCRHTFPDARVEGVQVSEMVKGGVETIVGAATDPSFGPVVMFGFGGIYVEVLKDVSFRVAPISRPDAKEMLWELRSAPMLYGARGDPPKDVESAVDAICTAAHLIHQVPEIMEMDLNPLLVLERGQGCKVLDARITLTGGGEMHG